MQINGGEPIPVSDLKIEYPDQYNAGDELPELKPENAKSVLAHLMYSLLDSEPRKHQKHNAIMIEAMRKLDSLKSGSKQGTNFIYRISPLLVSILICAAIIAIVLWQSQYR